MSNRSQHDSAYNGGNDRHEDRRDDNSIDDRASDELVSADGCSQIEALVRGAGQYVTPSEQLRPRVLEAAREQLHDRLAHRRMMQCAVVILLCGALSTTLADQFDTWRHQLHSITASEIEQQALEISSGSIEGTHWGLFEAFNQLRQSRAIRLQGKAPSSLR